MQAREQDQVTTTHPTLRPPPFLNNQLSVRPYSWNFCKDKKIFITEQVTDENPDYEPSSIYDSMHENNQATDGYDNTYDNMYEDDWGDSCDLIWARKLTLYDNGITVWGQLRTPSDLLWANTWFYAVFTYMYSWNKPIIWKLDESILTRIKVNWYYNCWRKGNDYRE